MKRKHSSKKVRYYKLVPVRKYEVEKTEDLLRLIEFYHTDWMHRDSFLWKQVFKYFFATLIVIIIPFTDNWILNFEGIIPKWIFPSVGIVLSCIFFIVGRGHVARLRASGKKYNDLFEMLPKDFRRITLDEIHKAPISNRSLAPILVYTMFFILITLSVVFLLILVLNI